MDDITKDMIPRKAVEYCLRKETVSTNPEAYKAHKKFIGYMDDPEISQFGHWMHANGYNCALVSVAVDLEKIPSAQPEWKWTPCSKEMPQKKGRYIVTVRNIFDNVEVRFRYWNADCKLWSGDQMDEVLAWCEIPEPWEGDANGED